ncbi:MAG: NUDIX domain-containing protein [Sphaerochaeta sp.]|nr:NUDIX domain-containing protein [Sphaerochaeta sp.]
MPVLLVPLGGGLLNIRIGAIIMKEGKFLMVGNTCEEYLYSVGGRVKFSESLQEAACREVYEETGLRMEIDRLGFVHENFFYGDSPTKAGRLIQEISFYFYMKTPAGFEPVCTSFSEDGTKEHLFWVDASESRRFFPEFFGEELKCLSREVKHLVTRDLPKVLHTTDEDPPLG